MKVEVPEDVLTALKAIIAWSRYYGNGDDGVDDVIAEHAPVVAAWLEGLGLLPPRAWPPEEAAE